MNSSTHTGGTSAEDNPVIWQSVANRFTEEQACLASFLAFETAEILDGVKPGSLVNIVNRKKPCGRNLYELWNRFGSRIMRSSPLRVELLRSGKDGLLLYLYRNDLLDTWFGSEKIRDFFTRAGYPAFSTPQAAIAELKRRMKHSEFPHEIGIFLGYPLKDVEGFLGWSRLPFTCQGPWKIYGDPRLSIALAESHRLCRRRMIQTLSTATDPLRCLADCSPPPGSHPPSLLQ